MHHCRVLYIMYKEVWHKTVIGCDYYTSEKKKDAGTNESEVSLCYEGCKFHWYIGKGLSLNWQDWGNACFKLQPLKVLKKINETLKCCCRKLRNCTIKRPFWAELHNAHDSMCPEQGEKINTLQCMNEQLLNESNIHTIPLKSLSPGSWHMVRLPTGRAFPPHVLTKYLLRMQIKHREVC